MQAAVERFGRIDVLVNNAGNFYAGFFEELTPEQFERQIATNLFGPMNVTRAVLPVMRGSDRALVSISSVAGIVGQDSAPPTPHPSSDSRAGWSRCASRSSRSASAPRSSSRASSAPSCSRGVHRLRRPVDRRLRRAHRPDPPGLGGDERQADQRSRQAREGSDHGLGQEQPPLRWVAGADAVAAVEQKANELLAQVDAHRDLSSSLAVD